jgi:hypothetical protein
MPAAIAAAAPDYRGLSVRLRLAKVTLGESRQCVYCGGIEWMCRRSARSSGQWGRSAYCSGLEDKTYKINERSAVHKWPAL